MKNNIVFLGSSRFSIFVIEKMIARNIIPSLIITTKPSKSGKKIIKSDIEIFCLENNMNFSYDINDSCEYKILILASYGVYIKPIFFQDKIFINVHPSMLPNLRGPAPIYWNILNNIDPGVSCIKMHKKIDAGDLIMQRRYECDIDNIYYDQLEGDLGALGGDMVCDFLSDIDHYWSNAKHQDNNHTYAGKISKSDALLNFNDSIFKNYAKIRAFNVWPGAYFQYKDDYMNVNMKIYKARIMEFSTSKNNESISFDKNIMKITCSDGFIMPEVVQIEGKKKMDIKSFINGIKGRKIIN